MHTRRVALLLAGTLALAACGRVAAPSPVVKAQESQPTDAVSGLQFVANNVATEAGAASASPLRATPLLGPDGAPVSGREVLLPQGFSMSVVATGLRGPRFMAYDDAGNLLVADAGTDTVVRFGPAGAETLVSRLNSPSNVALHQGYLYVGETSSISRYAYDAAGQVGAREVVVPNLPSGGHSTRTIAFGPDGMMYVSVGSSCNICDESDERRATVLRYAPDGSGYERFGIGLRNAVGLAFQPMTGLLWATVNERDNQGNEIPPDLVTIVRGGENFGWPGCVPPEATPQTSGRDCSGITPPTTGIQAHSAPLGLAFYNAAQFPAEYANDLFVVQHGSWNRQPPAAPKLLRFHFDGARPVSAMDFATGWQRPDGSRWGRPAGVIVAPDGSLIVSDDQAGVLYRISYQ